MMVRREAFVQVGGMSDDYFLYYEDTDLCWRLNIANWSVRFCPDAIVRHDYRFTKPTKWFYLERNRWLMILSNFEARTLMILAPVLLGAEIAICVAALRGRWFHQKLRASAAVVRLLPSIPRRRRSVGGLRHRGDAELWPMFTAAIDSPILAGPLIRLSNPVTSAYARIALHILRARRSTEGAEQTVRG